MLGEVEFLLKLSLNTSVLQMLSFFRHPFKIIAIISLILFKSHIISFSYPIIEYITAKKKNHKMTKICQCPAVSPSPAQKILPLLSKASVCL